MALVNGAALCEGAEPNVLHNWSKDVMFPMAAAGVPVTAASGFAAGFLLKKAGKAAMGMTVLTAAGIYGGLKWAEQHRYVAVDWVNVETDLKDKLTTLLDRNSVSDGEADDDLAQRMRGEVERTVEAVLGSASQGSGPAVEVEVAVGATFTVGLVAGFKYG